MVAHESVVGIRSHDVEAAGGISSCRTLSRLFVAGDSFFRLNGVCNSKRPNSNTLELPDQLILRAPSRHAAGMHRRFLHRALRLLLSSSPCPPQGAITGVRSYGQSRPDYGVFVPGAGAAEMSWSVMWDSAADTLLDGSHEGSSPGRYGPMQKLGSWIGADMKRTIVAQFLSRHPDISSAESQSHDMGSCHISEFPPTICEKCSYLVESFCSDHAVLRSTVNACVDACRLLATAYKHPPRRLLDNHFQAVVEHGQSTFSINKIFISWRENYRRNPPSGVGAVKGIVFGDDTPVRCHDTYEPLDPFKNNIFAPVSLFIQG